LRSFPIHFSQNVLCAAIRPLTQKLPSESWWRFDTNDDRLSLAALPLGARLGRCLQQTQQELVALALVVVALPIVHARQDNMPRQPPARIVKWPSDIEVKTAFEAYAAAVGKVAHAWNYADSDEVARESAMMSPGDTR
jgi:hypothetical protein